MTASVGRLALVTYLPDRCGPIHRHEMPIADQLDIARRLLTQQRLDIVEALAMLNALPLATGNDRVVRQARDAVSAVAMGTGKDLIVARYALARVIVLLEQRIAKEV